LARNAHPREDLLCDARGLVPRVLIRAEFEGVPVEVLFGFRGDALSIYFGDDPAFHFNSRGDLRRAFVGDRIIKAERGQLVSLTPKRSSDQTALMAMVMSSAAVSALLNDLRQRLSTLAGLLATNEATVLGCQPEDADPLPRIRSWLAAHSQPAIARSPRVC
jgi:hypothetical protein